MRRKVHRAGAFPDTLDPLMCRSKFRGVELIYLTVRGSVEESWSRQFLPEDQIVVLDLNLKEGEIPSNLDLEMLIRNCDLASILAEKQIDSLIIPCIRTPFTHRWAVRNGIRILGPSYELQRKLDNKIWFDRFLKRNRIPAPTSAVFNFSQSKELPFEGCTVIQDPTSTAGQGTFFVRSQEELLSLRRSKELQGSKNYLARKFVEGECYGIALFISPQVTALSALRKQCFFEEDDTGRKVFAGIQWVPSADLSIEVRDRIEDVFGRLARVLHSERYFGFANFDFLVDNEGYPQLIECNPRLSYASAQLFRFPELSSGIDLGKLFIEGFFGARQYSSPPVFFGLPETTYCGSQLETLPAMRVHQEKPLTKVKISKEHPAGLYLHSDRRVRFQGPDIRAFRRTKKDLVFYSSAKRGESYHGAEPVGRIVANFPLFTATGKLTRVAERLMSRFRHSEQ